MHSCVDLGGRGGGCPAVVVTTALIALGNNYFVVGGDDRFYIALFSALEQTHCARMSADTHHQNDFCIQIGSDENHFILSLIARGKVQDNVQEPQPLTLKECRNRKLNRRRPLTRRKPSC